MSETHVTHRERQFKEEMGCQVLHNYIKPAKKPTLHTWYELPKDVYVIGASELQLIRTKYIAWLLGRLDISDLDHIINETNEEQTMPSWSAFNSLITDEHVTKKNIGFLPVLPYPVTEYSVVYTSLKNFQDVLSQLDQSHLPVTCDEGVI